MTTPSDSTSTAQNNLTPRREFLKATAMAAAVATTSWQTRAAKGALPTAANEKIGVAAIGNGGRCSQLVAALNKLPTAEIVGVCDVYAPRAAQFQKSHASKAFIASDYRRILDRSDVDAVIITTPDHWHVPIAVAACLAGKDVYVEKPLTHTPDEATKILDAVAKTKRVVQVGTQQRSMPQVQAAAKIVKSGLLGDIHKVHCAWNRNSSRGKNRNFGIDQKQLDWKMFLGNAPQQPFSEYRFVRWRWFWDFGGGILTDLMVHWLDMAHLMLELEHPSTAQTLGEQYLYPGMWETPDTVQTLLNYPDNKAQVHFEGTFYNADRGAFIELMGSKGTLYLDRGRYEIRPEGRSKVAAQQVILGEGRKGQDFYTKPDGEALHLTNWLECIKSRGEPNSPVSSAVQVAAAAHLANKSWRDQQTAKWQGVGR